MCAKAVLVKYGCLMGLALAALGPSIAAPAAEMIRYQDPNGQVNTVWLEPGLKAWTIAVTTPQGKWLNATLFPAHHPLDETPLSDIQLMLNAKGFAVSVTYPVKGLVESIQISFETQAEGNRTNCPLRVSHFRKEQRYAPGQVKGGNLRSGLDVDFNAGVGRLLAIEGRPTDAPSVSVGLLSQERSFCELPSVLEFTPVLDIPKVR